VDKLIIFKMNSRAKGNRTVKKGRDILENGHWLFDTVEKTGRFTKIKDLFGLYDAIAVRGKYIKFIQFKTNKQGQKWKIPFKEWAKSHGSKYVSIEIWTWFDNKGFTIEVMENG